jgi:hypothetical protein
MAAIVSHRNHCWLQLQVERMHTRVLFETMLNWDREVAVLWVASNRLESHCTTAPLPAESQQLPGSAERAWFLGCAADQSPCITVTTL